MSTKAGGSRIPKEGLMFGMPTDVMERAIERSLAGAEPRIDDPTADWQWFGDLVPPVASFRSIFRAQSTRRARVMATTTRGGTSQNESRTLGDRR